jgi:CRP-like cAMP-binding protein
VPSALTTSNRILRNLTPDARALIWPHLARVDLPLRRHLETPNKAIPFVYFIESGFASVVASSGANVIEVGLIGREGMSGLAVLMGSASTTNATYMQLAGSGVRIAAETLQAAVDENKVLRTALLHYAHAFVVQASQTALANGRVKVEERLARWLLMAHDRVDGDSVGLTHEMLSVMLGVRRAGVTTVLAQLQEKGLVRIRRGAIDIVNRKGLEKLSRGTYGVSEREFQRLFG